MFQVTFLRVLCYALAIATIVLLWMYEGITYDGVTYLKFNGANVVNQAFEIADNVVKATARVIASLSKVDPYKAESIVGDRMHLDRTLIMSLLMLLWMTVLLFILRGHTDWHLRRAVIAIIIVHAILLIAWFGWTTETTAWYKAHENFVRQTLRTYGWYKAETLVIKALEMHSLLVFFEAVLLYSILGGFVAWLFRPLFRRSNAPAHQHGH